MGRFVGEESGAREEGHSAFYAKLGEVVQRVKAEMQGERAEREETEKTILRLLENACEKLNLLATKRRPNYD